MNKKQLKQQIKAKELQIEQMHLLRNNDICNHLYNSLILQKAILRKELAELDKNIVVDKLKRVFTKREKLICDYWK